jgi:cyclopropane fatty-acyl-phospholipid synthase-like methyltransferase
MRWRDRLYWETRYFLTPRWDQLNRQLRGILDQEASRKGGGRALDLGCGSGRVAVHLARQGLSVVALDVSGVALMRARLRALRAGVSIRFQRVDLLTSELRTLAAPSDLVVDVGFFHGLTPSARERHAAQVLQLLGPNSSLVLMGLRPGADRRVAGIDDSDLERCFPGLALVSIVDLSGGSALPAVLCVLRRA